MASQAAAILRVIERKRQEKANVKTLAKIQHIPQNTTLHVYSDRLTHQV